MDDYTALTKVFLGFAADIEAIHQVLIENGRTTAGILSQKKEAILAQWSKHPDLSGLNLAELLDFLNGESI